MEDTKEHVGESGAKGDSKDSITPTLPGQSNSTGTVGNSSNIGTPVDIVIPQQTTTVVSGSKSASYGNGLKGSPTTARTAAVSSHPLSSSKSRSPPIKKPVVVSSQTQQNQRNNTGGNKRSGGGAIGTSAAKLSQQRGSQSHQQPQQDSQTWDNRQMSQRNSNATPTSVNAGNKRITPKSGLITTSAIPVTPSPTPPPLQMSSSPSSQQTSRTNTNRSSYAVQPPVSQQVIQGITNGSMNLGILTNGGIETMKVDNATNNTIRASLENSVPSDQQPQGQYQAPSNLKMGLCKPQMVSITEMTDVLRVTKKQTGLKPKMWVRLKRGFFKDDLGQIDYVDLTQNQVHLKLLPRIDYTRMRGAMKDSAERAKRASANAAAGLGSKASGGKTRPPARAFNQEEIKKIGGEITNDGDFLLFESNRYSHKGLLYKSFQLNAIQTEGVTPTLAELEKFGEVPMDGFSGELAVGGGLGNVGVVGSSKDEFVHNFATGDNVEICDGELQHLQGKIVAIDGNKITVLPKHEDLKDPLDFQSSELRKYFQLGDHVRVIEGKFEGDTGLIVRVDSHCVFLFSDLTKHELKVLPKDLQLCSDIATGVDSMGHFQLGDLVQIGSGLSGNTTSLNSNVARAMNFASVAASAISTTTSTTQQAQMSQVGGMHSMHANGSSIEEASEGVVGLSLEDAHSNGEVFKLTLPTGKTRRIKCFRCNKNIRGKSYFAKTFKTELGVINVGENERICGACHKHVLRYPAAADLAVNEQEDIVQHSEENFTEENNDNVQEPNAFDNDLCGESSTSNSGLLHVKPKRKVEKEVSTKNDKRARKNEDVCSNMLEVEEYQIFEDVDTQYSESNQTEKSSQPSQDNSNKSKIFYAGIKTVKGSHKYFVNL